MKNLETPASTTLSQPEAVLPQEADTEFLVVPSLEAPDITLTQEGPRGWRKFFSNRLQQLSDFRKGVDTVAQRLFAEDIEGIHFTAKETLAARFHPGQLMSNLRNNLTPSNRQESKAYSSDPFAIYELNPIIDNPVLRDAAYRKAIDGDETALGYLRQYDRHFAETDIVERSAWKEHLAELSGAVAVRKLGLVAIAGVTVLQAIGARGDDERLDQLAARMNAIEAKDKVPLGTKKARQYKQQMDTLRQTHAHRHARKEPFDPFDM